ncbi:hypothetical protein BDV19DRAFT_76441 [Aspergillus venezuelensis]
MARTIEPVLIPCICMQGCADAGVAPTEEQITSQPAAICDPAWLIGMNTHSVGTGIQWCRWRIGPPTELAVTRSQEPTGSSSTRVTSHPGSCPVSAVKDPTASQDRNKMRLIAR